MWRRAHKTVKPLAALLLCVVGHAGAAQPTDSQAAAGRPNDMPLLVVDAAGNPLAKAVVWFAGDENSPLPPADAAIVDQIDKQFVPEVTVIRTGTEVQFPNRDSVSHHVYSFAQPNSFELPLYKGEARPTIRFDYAGIVTLGCNIHDAMLGYIVVVDTPHYGITDENGYAYFDVPPGTTTKVYVWSPLIDPSEPMIAEAESTADAAPVFQVARRQRVAPKPFSGSLAWEDY